LTSERQDATTAATEKMDFMVMVLVRYRERLEIRWVKRCLRGGEK